MLIRPPPTARACCGPRGLAVVAPGIAEALFATALGLAAAIPAVVAYNKFNIASKICCQITEACDTFFSLSVTNKLNTWPHTMNIFFNILGLPMWSSINI